jgi:hypothetical protein
MILWSWILMLGKWTEPMVMGNDDFRQGLGPREDDCPKNAFSKVCSDDLPRNEFAYG